MWKYVYISMGGALLFGGVSSIGLSENMYTILGTGFLGAYTAFSTFMYEGFNLFQDDAKLNAFVYIFGPLIHGIIGYATGFGIANLNNL